ncbi:DUF4012 domain-containing protein [Glaciihabitans tibetensis]|nr:DUF4012 domain-containing protein [Glaciihabitans tibetensis]
MRISMRWIIATLAVILVFSFVWVLARAIMARDELLGAVPIASRVGSQVLSDGADITADLDELQSRASNAKALTSDPIWRAAEFTPFIGENLVAFRQAASLVSDLADGALPPLSELAGTFDLKTLQPVNGRLELEAFSAAQPMLGEARVALDAADESAALIKTENTIPQIGSAVDQIVDLVSKAKGVIDGVDTAASLLPSMLGSEGPRSYLLLSLNNAELRATGGLPGAIAVIEADQGALQLGTLSSASALGELAEPVLDLSVAEETLYGDGLATYMHDVNYTPDFARSGELAQAIWLEKTGQSVDGVISVDPVALGYLLAATGDIDAGSGITLTSENAADVFLSEAYSLFEGPSQQDAFFAEATGNIFESFTRGGADARTLVESLARGADENRIHVWSADDNEQAQLLGTSVAGAVPVSTEASTGFGVYFNDATGAKMDYYLTGAVAIASGVCRNDERPNFEVKVRLSSSSPLDAATSLPPYVTGDGAFGVEPGNIRTNVFVYAPENSTPFSVTVDGEEHAFVAAEHDAHSVAGITVELSPGEASVVSMKFVGPAGAAEAVALQHTPMTGPVESSLDNYLDCDSVAPAPIEDENESGA